MGDNSKRIDRLFKEIDDRDFKSNLNKMIDESDNNDLKKILSYMVKDYYNGWFNFTGDEILICLYKISGSIDLEIDVFGILYFNNIDEYDYDFRYKRKRDWKQYLNVLTSLVARGATVKKSWIGRNPNIQKYFSNQYGGIRNNDIQALFVYADVGFVKFVLNNLNINLRDIKISDWCVQLTANVGNSGMLDWILEIFPQKIVVVKNKLHKAFKDERYDLVISMIKHRDSFKTTKAAEYLSAYCQINDIDSVKILLNKGIVTKTNIVKIRQTIDLIENEASKLVIEEISKFDVANKPKDQDNQKLSVNIGDIAVLNSQLIEALQQKDSKTVSKLIQSGAAINNDGEFVLIATKQNDLDSASILIRNKAKVNGEYVERDNSNKVIKRASALHFALEHLNDEMAELLVKNNASVMKVNEEQECPLSIAARNNKIDLVKIMFDYTKEVSAEIAVSVLDAAVRSGNLEMVQLVFDKLDSFEFTSRAFGYACRLGFIPIVKYLISKGCSFEDSSYNFNQIKPRFYKYRTATSATGDRYDNFYGYLLKDNAGYLTRNGRTNVFLKYHIDPASINERLAVLKELMQIDFLSDKQLGKLLCLSVNFDEPEFIELLDSRGVKVVDDSLEKSYLRFIVPSMSLTKTKYVCSKLKKGEFINLTPSYLKSDINVIDLMLNYVDLDNLKRVQTIIKFFIDTNSTIGLEILSRNNLFNSNNIVELIEYASINKRIEPLAYLMKLKNDEFQAVEGNFDL